MLDTENIVIAEKLPEYKNFSPLNTQIEMLKEHRIPTFSSFDVIIESENTSIIKIPNTLLAKLKSDMTMGEKIMNTKELMPRKETEKEISRLDNDISEIKTDLKEIRTDLKEIRRDYVTKDYLNNEFKNSLINEIKIMNQADKKEFRKWFITAILIPIIIALIPYIIDLGNKILTYIQSK